MEPLFCCCWAATMSAGFICSMFIDASIFAMKSSPLLLNAEGFVVAAGAAVGAGTGAATGLGLGAAVGAAGGTTAAVTGAGGSSSETGRGCCTKVPRLAGAGDAFTGVESSASAALLLEVAAPAELVVLFCMRMEEWRDMGDGAAAEGDMPIIELERDIGEAILMLAERRRGDVPLAKVIGGASLEKDLRMETLSGVALGVVSLLMLLLRRIVWNEVGSSKAGAFIALVCEECNRLITLSISAWDRRFTEEARSSLGSTELRFFSMNDSERGVEESRS